jgi:hypothetical protein
MLMELWNDPRQNDTISWMTCTKTFIAINVNGIEFALDVSRVTVTPKTYRFKKNVSWLSLGQEKAVIDRNDDKAPL